MILNTDKPEVEHIGQPVARIDMSQMDAESIAVMLENSRDGFYSNKELAPVREYSTNARDAHIQAGIPTRPIEVHLPSQMEPELKIRDYGNGLSIEQMTDVYFRYWKSTKRHTNDQNGCLGIGAKSALAYAPAYTVTSWNNGMKIVATGQKNGFADIILNARNVDNEPDGIEITIPIQLKDISKFVHEALNFYKYWDIRPIITNIDEETLKGAFNIMDTTPFLSGEGWAVRPAGYGKGDTKAVMGFVPYAIDWNQVRNSLAPETAHKVSNIYTFLEENLTTLYFANGTLSFTPNREALQYNESTVKALGEKLVEIYTSLLNLISSKISDASNLWEAKIAYNRIFRKEVDGFDKNETYAGNLSTIENILRNRIQWNGIPLENGYFEELESWDATDGHSNNSYNDNPQPVLTTYVKNDDRTGIALVSSGRRRRWSSDTQKIVCSPKSVIIIQDTDKLANAKGLARYFLYKSSTPVSQVYVLNLANTDVRDAFVKHYNFETVPVTYVSANELLIKTYLKSIRAPRSDSGANRESRPLNCPSMEIKDRRSSGYVSTPYWNTETVNARGIQSGYYVVYSKNTFQFGDKTINHEDANMFWQSIYELALLAGVNLPKVYGIHPKFAEASWFKDEVEEGNWTPLSEFVKENVGALPADIIKKVHAFRSSETLNGYRVGTVVAGDLHPLITKTDGLASTAFAELMEINKHWNIRDIPVSLHLSGFNCEEAEISRFRTMNNDIKTKYPLMFQLEEKSAVQACGSSSYRLKAETKTALADYINMVDAVVPVTPAAA